MSGVVESVAALAATGAVQGLSGQAAIDAVAAIRDRIRKVFGHDARAVAALDGAVSSGGSDPTALNALAEALRWYAGREAEFAVELERWAVMAPANAVQNLYAQRDAYAAGRDQTIVNIDRSAP